MTGSVWLVPCPECGRERPVRTDLWMAWLFPCRWCDRIKLRDSRWR